jgi:hypothetical protein
MAKIVSKKLWFDQLDMTDVKFFNIYYVKAPTPVTYDTPKVVITAVPGQTAYEVDVPLMVPIGEGTYNLGVSAVDSGGNISDIDVMTRPFDFTAPVAPKWRVME